MEDTVVRITLGPDRQLKSAVLVVGEKTLPISKLTLDEGGLWVHVGHVPVVVAQPGEKADGA